MKRKNVPKRKIADEAGGEDWEVVDKRKTVLVEESSEDDQDLSSDDGEKMKFPERE